MSVPVNTGCCGSCKLCARHRSRYSSPTKITSRPFRTLWKQWPVRSLTTRRIESELDDKLQTPIGAGIEAWDSSISRDQTESVQSTAGLHENHLIPRFDTELDARNPWLRSIVGYAFTRTHFESWMLCRAGARARARTRVHVCPVALLFVGEFPFEFPSQEKSKSIIVILCYI